MYLAGMCFQGVEKCHAAFGSLGLDWLSMGASLLTSAAGKGQSGPQTTVTTTTAVNTQVSPQISPMFIQQSSPQNSPVNAGAAMQPPGFTPITGSIPGLDYEGYLHGPALPQTNVLPYAAAGIALIGLAFVLKKKA